MQPEGAKFASVCCMSMLIKKKKKELVFCMSLFFLISLLRAFISVLFYKRRSLLHVGRKRPQHNGRCWLMGWELCRTEALDFIPAEIQESCRSCLRQAGPAGRHSHQVYVSCQTLCTERIVLGSPDSQQQAEALDVEPTAQEGLRSGKQHRQNSNGAPGVLKPTLL